MKDGKIIKYKDEYWKTNVEPKHIKFLINKLVGDISNINQTKHSRIKKIRILENGKSIETFSVQCLRINENVFNEGDIQFKRIARKSVKHLHFTDKCDLIITELSFKKKKEEAIIINVHGNVYYPDGSRRYDNI